MTHSIMTFSITDIIVPLCLIYCYAECRYDECHYDECCYEECLYAKCSYDVCRYAECRGTLRNLVSRIKFNQFKKNIQRPITNKYNKSS